MSTTRANPQELSKLWEENKVVDVGIILDKELDTFVEIKYGQPAPTLEYFSQLPWEVCYLTITRISLYTNYFWDTGLRGDLPILMSITEYPNQQNFTMKMVRHYLKQYHYKNG